MQECIFCKIIHRSLSATILYEDEDVVAFDDIDPKAPIHTLVIPKHHIATLNDLLPKDTHLIGHMMYVAAKIATTLDIAETGYRTVFNCNPAGGQMVFHLHLHLLGGRQMLWPPG